MKAVLHNLLLSVTWDVVRLTRHNQGDFDSASSSEMIRLKTVGLFAKAK